MLDLSHTFWQICKYQNNVFESCVSTPYQLFTHLYCPFCEANDQLWHQCYPQWKATDVLLHFSHEGDSTLCSVYSALWSNLCIQCCISMKGPLHKIYCGNQHAHDTLGFVGRRYDSRTRDLNAKKNTNKKLHSAIRPPCCSELNPLGDLFRVLLVITSSRFTLVQGTRNAVVHACCFFAALQESCSVLSMLNLAIQNYLCKNVQSTETCFYSAPT